jgi:lysophospholipase L1-like esterase
VLPGLPGPGTACVLRAAEANQIRARIASYNHVIAARARELCGALVDVHTLVQQLARIGYKAGPLRLTTDFLGGLFSLDGIHPTNTGYAILANEILEQMKRQLHINITPVNVVQVARRDPLVPPAGW